MDFSKIKEEGYFVSADKSLLDVNYIHQYLSAESYWAKNIPLEKVKKSIDNSFCIAVYQNKQQIGFARVITDYATFGYLADVFIDGQHRGKGLSKFLMHEIMNHPDLQGLRRISLFTQDAHGLYRLFGFGPTSTPENYMEIRISNPYSPQ